MDIKHQITDMAEAVTRQCGLLASVTRIHFASGGVMTKVQVCLDHEVNQGAKWCFFEAESEADLPHLRDELVEFIQKHRRVAA